MKIPGGLPRVRKTFRNLQESSEYYLNNLQISNPNA